MSERKKLDQIFQEKLGDFETVPPEVAWENIKIKLEKKKKRRMIPLWWKLSGVACSLLLGVWISRTLLFDTRNDVMIQEGVIQSAENPKYKSTPLQQSSESTQIVVAKDSSETRKNVNETLSPSMPLKRNNRVATISSDTKNKSTTDLIYTTKNSISKRKAIANNTNETTNSTIHSMNSNRLATKTDEKERTIKYQEANSKTNALMEKEEKRHTAFDISNESTKLAVKDSSKHELPKVEEIKKTVEIAATENNELDKLLKEKEDKTTKKEKNKRWQINTSVAPVYYNSLTDGSPLDSQFETNQKEYNTSQSFGVGINYALSKKVKVRTGINTVAVNYDTNDVQLNPTFTGGLNISIQGTPINIKNIGIYGTKNPNSTGIINQKMGYVEVPLELSYQIVNKRFGLEFIGGVSTLFLTQNSITMKLEQEKINLGGANNLNTVHYSGNLGLGLKYGIMKQLEFKIEPVLKYQFNPFSSTNTNSKTYIFGLYSGIGFNF